MQIIFWKQFFRLNPTCDWSWVTGCKNSRRRNAQIPHCSLLHVDGKCMNWRQREFENRKPRELGHGAAVMYAQPECHLWDPVHETQKIFCLPNVEKERCLSNTHRYANPVLNGDPAQPTESTAMREGKADSQSVILKQWLSRRHMRGLLMKLMGQETQKYTKWKKASKTCILENNVRKHHLKQPKANNS